MGQHMSILSWFLGRKILILYSNGRLYNAILDLLVMWSLKVSYGSSITQRNFMFLLSVIPQSPTLSDNIMCLSKLFMVPKTKNSIFESVIFNWFSVIHFLMLFSLHSRVLFTVCFAWLEGFGEGVIIHVSWQVMWHYFLDGTWVAVKQYMTKYTLLWHWIVYCNFFWGCFMDVNFELPIFKIWYYTFYFIPYAEVIFQNFNEYLLIDNVKGCT